MIWSHHNSQGLEGNMENILQLACWQCSVSTYQDDDEVRSMGKLLELWDFLTRYLSDSAVWAPNQL